MRAYRCDACGRLFLLPGISSAEIYDDENEIFDEYVPMDLTVYHGKGTATCYDICRECADEILALVNAKRTEYGAGGGC